MYVCIYIYIQIYMYNIYVYVYIYIGTGAHGGPIGTRSQSHEVIKKIFIFLSCLLLQFFYYIFFVYVLYTYLNYICIYTYVYLIIGACVR
jgi:hypothetical protein